MFVKQFKDNLKGLLLWCACFVALLVMVFSIYPTIMANSQDKINQLLQVFPKEVLSAFNMTDIATPSGWVNSEGMVFVLLFGAIYSAMLGIQCVYKEKKSKTIEFLAAKPVSREQILAQKAGADLLCILLFTAVNALTIFIGLKLSDDLDVIPMLQITLTPLLVYLVFYTLTVLISILWKGTTGIAMGIAMVFYLIAVLSRMTSQLDFLKFCSPFTLSDTAAILQNGHLTVWHYVAAGGLTVVLGAGSFIAYQKKELV